MKKKIIGILAAVLSAGILAGCGAADSEKALKDIQTDKYVTLGEYKGIEVTMDPIVVDEMQIDSLFSNVYYSSITAETGGFTDRAVENGDIVNIDYVGKKDDVAFDGGSAEGAILVIGSGQFIDGFEEGLLGVMPGTTVDLPLTFPTDYTSTDLAGAEVVFTVTVNFIVPTEVKDELVTAIGIEDVSNEEQLRQYIYDYLYTQQESSYNSSLQNTILNTVMTNSTFQEMPEYMVTSYENMARDGVAQNAASFGVDADTFTQNYYGIDFETFVSEYALNAVKQDMLIQAIANKEGMAMDEEELNSTLLQYATGSGYDTVEEFIGDTDIELYRIELVSQKVLQFLSDNAVVK